MFFFSERSGVVFYINSRQETRGHINVIHSVLLMDTNLLWKRLPILEGFSPRKRSLFLYHSWKLAEESTAAVLWHESKVFLTLNEWAGAIKSLRKFCVCTCTCVYVCLCVCTYMCLCLRVHVYELHVCTHEAQILDVFLNYSSSYFLRSSHSPNQDLQIQLCWQASKLPRLPCILLSSS